MLLAFVLFCLSLWFVYFGSLAPFLNILIALTALASFVLELYLRKHHKIVEAGLKKNYRSLESCTAIYLSGEDFSEGQEVKILIFEDRISLMNLYYEKTLEYADLSKIYFIPAGNFKSFINNLYQDEDKLTGSGLSQSYLERLRRLPRMHTGAILLLIQDSPEIGNYTVLELCGIQKDAELPTAFKAKLMLELPAGEAS